MFYLVIRDTVIPSIGQQVVIKLEQPARVSMDCTCSKKISIESDQNNGNFCST